MTLTVPPFAEHHIGEMYDRSFANLLRLWNGDPVQHAGYFVDLTDDDYRAAAERTSRLLVAEAGISASSRVLDVGSGCGDLVLFLAERIGCRAVGLDLSAAHIAFASARLADRRGLDAFFNRGSVTRLPYSDASFTHVVSQDALYHVLDKPRAHAEIFRVLESGGVLACCDFLQPNAEVSERVRHHIYQRMLRNGGYSLVEYQVALERAGFEIMLARNLDQHFRRSYQLLAGMARAHARAITNPAERRAVLSYLASCLEIQAAIARGEFGWGLFVARKPRSAAAVGHPSARLIAALAGDGAADKR